MLTNVFRSELKRFLPFLARRTPESLAGFDRQFYLEMNVDVRDAKVDPLDHFLQLGWREGRNPSRGFSLADYLSANPDVEAAGINPLIHFVECGLAEGRRLRLDASPPGTGGSLASNAPGFASMSSSNTDDRIARFHRAPAGQRGRLV